MAVSPLSRFGGPRANNAAAAPFLLLYRARARNARGCLCAQRKGRAAAGLPVSRNITHILYEFSFSYFFFCKRKSGQKENYEPYAEFFAAANRRTKGKSGAAFPSAGLPVSRNITHILYEFSFSHFFFCKRKSGQKEN